MGTFISAKTPKGMAGKTLRAIKKMPGGEYASMRPTEWGAGWQVVWEEGPYEWTQAATGGADIFRQEYYSDGYRGSDATFEFDYSHVFPEPQNHYALNFWKA